ncbi:uncharacterized protein LOC141905910 isoform X2 [Tubulanus polymorphus]|uniref:uncharacterized protein LOC141905910 isoform X2 n=1 Tax=Tubulanus polymorphus TaxID=672921 RepID=UPI003DA6078F
MCTANFTIRVKIISSNGTVDSNPPSSGNIVYNVNLISVYRWHSDHPRTVNTISTPSSSAACGVRLPLGSGKILMGGFYKSQAQVHSCSYKADWSTEEETEIYKTLQKCGADLNRSKLTWTVFIALFVWITFLNQK